MIDYAGKNAFEESHNIRLKAIVGSNTHYLDNIADFNLIESLMSSDTFELGCCESASVSFNMLDDTLKKGDTVQLNLEVEGYDDFNLCKIVIDSVTLSEDKKTRKVIAYDEFYGILNNDYTEFYSNQFGDAESIDFDVFIGAFLTHVGLSHSLNLPKFAIFKVDGTITGSTILNGLFGVLGGLGHLNRNGSLVLLKPNLTVDMQVSNITSGKKMYASCNCKDFATQTFQDAGFYVYEFGSDLPQVIHAGENPYVIKNNIFITDVSKQTIDFNAIYNAYKTFSYVPVDDLYVLGNPCYEVGDTIEIELDDGTKIKTIMFERTLSNIIGMRDEISSKGTEVVEVDNNDLTSKIQQNYNKIMLSVNTKADKTETEASITLLEGKIEQKVTIGESYNGVTIDENGINAEGTGSLVISMANVELTEDGYMIIQGGEIGPLTITNDEIYANFFEDKKSYSIDFTYEQTTHTPQGDVTKDISTSADLIYTESLKAFRLSVDNIFKEMIFGFFYDEADLQDETPAYIYTQDGVKKAYTGSTTAVYKYFTDDNTLNVIYKNELYELDEKDTYGIVDDTYTRTSYKFVNGDDFIYYYSDTPTPPSSGTTDDYDESLAKAIEDAFGNVIGKDMKAFDVTKSHFKLGSGFDYEYIHDLLNITSAKIGGFNISESSISTDGMSLTSKTDDGVASVSVYGEDENNAYQQVNVNHKDSVTMYGMNKRTGQLYKTGKMSNVATTDELSGITYSTGRLALNGYSTTTQQPVEDRIVLDAKDGVVLNTDVIKLGSNNVKNIGNRANKSTSSVSVKSADHTVVCSQQLTAGTFIVVGSVRFQGNATGYRQVNIGSTDWTPEKAVRSNNVGSSSQVIVEKTRIITLTETTTINLYAFQNSGVTLDCGGRLSCIRMTS